VLTVSLKKILRLVWKQYVSNTEWMFKQQAAVAEGEGSVGNTFCETQSNLNFEVLLDSINLEGSLTSVDVTTSELYRNQVSS
jgi:hypothetical protein